MNTTKAAGELTPALVSEQVDISVKSLVTSADNTSVDRIQNLGLVHQARISRLTRTAADVATQYGDQSTQAKAAQDAVKAAQTTVAQIDSVHRQATTTAPQVAAAGWALHGRVFNAELQPMTGHTVFLVNSEKAYQSAYGFAYTDSTGYFLISFAGAAKAPAGRVAESAANSSQGLFIEVTDTKTNPVYLSTVAFQPVAGAAQYQNITLQAGEPALGDPPEAIRKLAIPSAKKTS